ncbi:UNVERIFIED_CONTAM: hypothetical protein H355_014948 [Colinus virginianus]|nr:hypothetical protein H355_014948 [Colinus virginianus]
MPSTDVLVASQDSSGQGELCFRGRNVFMGYYKDADSTQEVLDRHAFLHTGDLGMVDEDGFLFITGRIKELLITAGGENVAPLLLEANLMQELPSLLSHCMVVGDRRRFLAVLVCLYTAHNTSSSVSSHELSPEVLRVIRPLGSTSKTLQDAQQDPIINALIKAAIQRANEKTISRQVAKNVDIAECHRWRHWWFWRIISISI